MATSSESKTIFAVRTTKSGATIIFDDGSKMKIGVHAYTDQPLYPGKTLSPRDMRTLNANVSNEKYYDKALKLCLANSKTVHEVYEYLEKKGADEKSIKSIIRRLCDAGLLNDKLYAQVFATDVASLRLYGRSRVIFELKRHGIPDAILSELPFDEEVEKERALTYAKILNRKLTRVPNGKKIAKIADGLLRRGFSESIAFSAASEASTPNDEALERIALRREYLTYRAKYEKKYSGYELKQRIYAALIRKGHHYDDIKAVEEENGYDD